MYGLQSDTAPSVPVRWQPDELEAVVSRLAADFPGKTAAELEHAVEYCKGAVRRYQGVDALYRFAGALLHSVDLHMAKLARGLPQ
jgi:hypothetical protein